MKFTLTKSEVLNILKFMEKKDISHVYLDISPIPGLGHAKLISKKFDSKAKDITDYTKL